MWPLFQRFGHSSSSGILSSAEGVFGLRLTSAGISCQLDEAEDGVVSYRSSLRTGAPTKSQPARLKIYSRLSASLEPSLGSSKCSLTFDMAAKKGGAEGQPEAVLLELLQEKHRLEEEIAAKDAEVKQYEAQYISHRRKLEEDQRQSQTESLNFSSQLSTDKARVDVEIEQLGKLRADYDRIVEMVAAAEAQKEKVKANLQLEQEEAKLEYERRKKELDLEKLNKGYEAASMKAARAEELKLASERYREELRQLREQETRQKELLQGLQTACIGWQGLLEKKKREQLTKQQELTKLQTQLSAVHQHVSSLETACSPLKTQYSDELTYLTADTEHLEQLKLEVQAAQASCVKLQSAVAALNSQSDRLETHRRQLINQLKRESDEQLRLQREVEVVMGGLDRVNADYKQEDHRVAFVLVPEEEKICSSLRQLERACKEMQDSHRLQRDFLLTQKDGLQRLKQTTPKPDFNLDTRYTEPRSKPEAPKPLAEKTPELKEQLISKQRSLEQLKTQMTGLSARLEELRKRTVRTNEKRVQKTGTQRQVRNLLVLAGVALGVLLEFWMQ